MFVGATSSMSCLSSRLLSERARGGLSRLPIARSSRFHQKMRLGGVVSHCVGTSAPDSREDHTPKPKTAILDRVVGKLNDSIKKHPGETIAVLFASDICSIGAMYGVISVTGLDFSPEFALAFAASRPFRRFRLPLDLAVAAGVAKVFPAFSRVRLSDLTGALPKWVELPTLIEVTEDAVTTVVTDSFVVCKLGAVERVPLRRRRSRALVSWPKPWTQRRR